MMPRPSVVLQSGYCDRSGLLDYLTNFTGDDPVKAATCPFVQDAGAGMGLAVFSLLFFGGIGLALSIRVRHPGPVLVSFMLTGGVVALSVPGRAVQMLALVLLFGIAGLGIYLYQRAQTSL